MGFFLYEERDILRKIGDSGNMAENKDKLQEIEEDTDTLDQNDEIDDSSDIEVESSEANSDDKLPFPRATITKLVRNKNSPRRS